MRRGNQYQKKVYIIYNKKNLKKTYKKNIKKLLTKYCLDGFNQDNKEITKKQKTCDIFDHILNSICISKENSNALHPTVNNCGYDLYTCEAITLIPFKPIKISVGVSISINCNTTGKIFGDKVMELNGIIVYVKILAPFDTKEIFIIILNITNKKKHIRKGEKIAQLIFEKIEKIPLFRNNSQTKWLNKSKKKISFINTSKKKGL